MATHRVSKGQKRLKVTNGRSFDHYCLDCAKLIIAKDTETLRGLGAAIEAASISSA
jgi:hypothetical protein